MRIRIRKVAQAPHSKFAHAGVAHISPDFRRPGQSLGGRGGAGAGRCRRQVLIRAGVHHFELGGDLVLAVPVVERVRHVVHALRTAEERFTVYVTQFENETIVGVTIRSSALQSNQKKNHTFQIEIRKRNTHT